ncbi:MAG: altronate dehydratase family protein [Planctomycetaceae bacterium]|nr:altronate dehydratase family protein [Planctomycetaceae bacterium]
MSQSIVLTPGDNVGVALGPIPAGTKVHLADGGVVVVTEAIAQGHKFALRPIASGADVIKYGLPIGHATADIAAGAWVHTHNTKTNLSGELDYVYTPAPAIAGAETTVPTFMGYRRPNGKVGIRNEVWVIPTVGCVNYLTETLAKLANEERPDGVGAVVAFPHNYGCSQMGDDHEATRTILADLARHPNAAAVLCVGLGCENNVMSQFRELIESDPSYNRNIDYMIAQEEGDEEAAGMEKLRRLMAAAASFAREPVPVSELVVGLKCGGSDGLSGVTANPLLGRFADWLVDRGGRIVLSEVPEMFGAERPLLDRAVSREVFDKGVRMINDFKRFYADHNQPIYENPSPGNKDGGITTLEDKSLGCTQKAGSRPVVDVLGYGEVVKVPGVSLLSGPGNDLVAVTALVASGAHIVMFTTGRGTPLGSPAPVIKVATNTALATKKPHWIDFDAGTLVAGESMDSLLERYARLVVETASGKKTRSEEKNMRDFAIFKTGVTL